VLDDDDEEDIVEEEHLDEKIRQRLVQMEESLREKEEQTYGLQEKVREQQACHLRH